MDVVFDLVAGPPFIAGVVGGVLAVGLALLLWAKQGRRIVRYGGLLVAVATVVPLYQLELMTRSPLVGVALLAIAGSLHRHSATIAVFFAIPGVFFVFRPDAWDETEWLVWVALLAVLVAAPLIATFDDRFFDTGLPLPFFGIASLGVFLTVPDTEGALVLLGVAGLTGFLGWPKAFASLGGAGSYAVVGVYFFVAAHGAQARPASIVACIGALGLLLIIPVVGWLRDRSWVHRLAQIDALIPLLLQLALVVLVARTGGRIGWVPGAAAVTIVTLSAAAGVALMVPADGRSQLPD